MELKISRIEIGKYFGPDLFGALKNCCLDAQKCFELVADICFECLYDDVVFYRPLPSLGRPRDLCHTGIDTYFLHRDNSSG